MGERSEWRIEKTEAVARGGMVAAMAPAAAEAGAATLRRGGNAVDAAVVTAFAVGVVEPWMSGIGGGGFMVVQLPDRDPAVVEFPMVSPAAATPEMFPLSGGGADAALFGWPTVEESANVVGHRAVAVPGTVAGLALALERFGTISLTEALVPAIALAEEGFPTTWHTTLSIARGLTNLRRFPATAAIFCPDGLPPVTLQQTAPAILCQTDLARTLRAIASDGPRAFYEGEIGEAIAHHLAEGGSPMTAADLAGYQPTVAPPLTTIYAGHDILTAGKGSGGTTLAEILNLFTAAGVGELTHNSVAALNLIAGSLRQAFADRYTYLADPDHVAVPWEALASLDYARDVVASWTADRRPRVAPGPAEALGIDHGLGRSMVHYFDDARPNQAVSGCTTHLSVVDRQGGAVSLTNTLLDGWGSRVVVPRTGVLLNNGMMWFDPEPGRPNSVAGGKRPLSNMAPLVIAREGMAVATLGARGGRYIMACNAQLVSNLLDHRLSMQAAIDAPRVDASTVDLFVSPRLPAATRDGLAALGHRLSLRDERLFLGEYASPVGVLIAADGFHAGVDPYYFPSTAVGA